MRNPISKEMFPLNLFLSVALWCSAATIMLAQEPGHLEDHVAKEKPKHTNALAKETSPYLLMHAHNPVNWYAWNEETLSKAKELNKPIFLSIGYSSCHWCHVMERESFMDEEIAAFLNENFICIKVDREERPDVDEIYMEALMTWNRISRNGRGGGWPLSMFMLPDGRPFFGGTYFPARTGDRGSRVGFLTVAQKIHQFFVDNRDRVEKDAALITSETKKSLEGRISPEGQKIEMSWIKRTLEDFESDFDSRYGGFRFSERNENIPKFPEPSNLLFLLERIQGDVQNEIAQKMLLTTCDRMMMGGIYDHVGGGFHRYSVDRYWRIPHYEKMLYDNGQLASVFAELYQLTGQMKYRWTAEGILSFVNRELKSKSGGFYSALDAESEGVEGKFYIWKKEEVKAALTEEEFQLFASLYGFNGAPNFEGSHYTPMLTQPLSEHAKKIGTDLSQLKLEIDVIHKKLFAVREQRPRPLLDTKILTSWNGLMIRGFADAGRIFEEPEHVETAITAANFVVENLATSDFRLYRTFTDGQARLNAYLIDYACLIDGLLAIHRATSDKKWLELADEFQKKQNELFWDEKHGGYFYTSDDHEVLLVRSKRAVDNVIPAGNSVAAANLIYLSEKLDNPEYRKLAIESIISASAVINQVPVATPRLLISASRILQTNDEETE